MRSRGPAVVVVVAALVVALLPGVANGAPRQAQPDWLATWNAYRTQSGLQPVSEDPDKSHADRLHAEYLIANQTGGHYEDPSAPGYTPEGAEAGAKGNVSVSSDETTPDTKPIGDWLGGPFHNVGMLRPELQEVGFGSARRTDGFVRYAAAAWVIVDEYTEPRAQDFPILFPGDGATMPLVASCCESPDPVTACPGYGAQTGLILTAQLVPPTPFDAGGEPTITGSTFRRVSPDVAELDHCLVPGSQYTNPDPQSQDLGRQLLSGAAYLVPRAFLEAGATYEASIAYDGTEVRWSFTVGPLDVGAEPPPPIPDGPARQIIEEDAARTAIAASQERFHDGQATLALISRDDDFADALAGTPLLGAGPLLLTSTGALLPSVAAELQRVLPGGSEVVVLGGEAAIAPAVRQQLRDLGYRLTELAGATRIDTAIAIARRVAGSGAPQVALARAFGTATDPSAAWADSIAAGAWLAQTGTPLLLTPTEELAPSVAEAIEDLGAVRTIVLGGTAALSDDVAAASPQPRRVAGATRAATAVAIAEQLVGTTDAAVLVDGSSADGWVAGLSAAGIASGMGAPVLLAATSGLPPETAGAISTCVADIARLLVLGDRAFVAATQDALTALPEDPACAAGVRSPSTSPSPSR